MRVLILIIAILMAGCESPTQPNYADPPGAVPMDPVPEVYSYWFDGVSQCAGVEATFSDIMWMEVPGDHWTDPRWSNPLGGLFSSPDTIYIATGRKLEWSTVAHEILHFLLWVDHQNRGHPEPPFGTCVPLKT